MRLVVGTACTYQSAYGIVGMCGADCAGKEAILHCSFISPCQSANVHALYLGAIGTRIFRVILRQCGEAVAEGHGAAAYVRGPRLCHDAARLHLSVAHYRWRDSSTLYRYACEVSVIAYAEQGVVDAIDGIPAAVVVAVEGVFVRAYGSPVHHARQVDGCRLSGIDGEIVADYVREPLHVTHAAQQVIAAVEAWDVGIEPLVFSAEFSDKFFLGGHRGRIACIVVLVCQKVAIVIG